MSEIPASPTDPPIPLDVTPDRYGASMNARFGPLYHAIGFGQGLDHVRLEDHAVEVIRDAATRGPVVYVLPRTSSLDHLALNAALAHRGLPLSAWAPRIGTRRWLPLGAMWRSVVGQLRDLVQGNRPPEPTESGWIVRALRAGLPLTWFVDDRPGWLAPRPAAFDPLVAAADLDPPVQLVPIMVVWERSPDRVGPLAQFFLGKQGVPGWARRWWRAMRTGDAFVQVGRPIDLRALSERIGKERLAGVVRRMTARNLGDERKLVAGPRLLPYGTLKKLVLDNPPMRQFAKQEARDRGVAVERVEREMSRDYHRIAANFSWTIIEGLHILLRPLWTRVFSGVDARPQDLDRIRAAMRDGTVVFAPCHRSHFDYVLMSWVMYDHDLIVPHVVAGMNLAVWPISIALRGAGGFFVKRSFSGDKVFSTVFARYLRELVVREYPVEFFIEGGRTRTGRLMPPKMGVLSMVLDAAAVRPHGRDVTVLPIALAYEQVAEEGAYARELGGEPKRPETLGQLIRARSVLRRRFGRVYLRVGEPVTCGALVDEGLGTPAWPERPPEERKQLAAAVAQRIVAEIGRRMVLLPTALVACALVAVPRRAILATELQERILRLDALFRRFGTERAASLDRFDQAIAQTLDRFVRDGRIAALEHQGRRLWAIDPEQRVMLDFYKNQVLHLLAPAGLVACAIRAEPEGIVALDRIRPAVQALERLLRRELVLDPDVDLTAVGAADLVAHGAVREVEGGVEVADPVRIGELHGLFRPLVEGYLALLRAPIWPETREGAANAVRAAQSRLLADGTVTCPESLSVAALQSAVGTYVEDGVLQPNGDRLRLGAGAEDLAARLAAMVGIR